MDGVRFGTMFFLVLSLQWASGSAQLGGEVRLASVQVGWESAFTSGA